MKIMPVTHLKLIKCKSTIFKIKNKPKQTNKNSQQRKAQQLMVSVENFTKHLKKK